MGATALKNPSQAKPSGKPALSAINGGGQGDGRPKGNLSPVPNQPGGKESSENSGGRGGLKGLPGGGQGNGIPSGKLASAVPGGKAIGGARQLAGGDMQGAETLGKEGLKELAKVAVKAAIANPEVSVPIGTILIIILFIVFMIVGDSTTTDTPPDPCSGAAGAPPDTLQIKNDGPQTAKIGDILPYHIVVTDTQQDQEIVIIEHLPPGVSLAPQDITSSWQKMTVDPVQKTITWKASENLPPAGGGAQVANVPAPNNGAPVASGSGSLSTTNFTIDFTLKATADNTTLVTYSEANPTRNAVNLVANTAPLPGAASSNGSGALPQDTWNQLLAMDSKYGTVWTNFLNDALTVSKQEDYPVAVIVGQAAQETGRGTSTMSKTKNNFFGYKAYDSNTDAASTYATPADSIKDYVKLIKGGNGGKNPAYLEAYANRANPQKMVELIKAGGYATDPNYVAGVTGQPEFKLLAGIPSGSGGIQLASTTSGGCPGSNQPQPAGGGPAGYIAPAIDTCGKYNLTNPLGKNFGDPSCNDPGQAFTKDKLNAELLKDDPANAQRFYQLAMCESSYNPNAYNPHTPDPAGAWGLFQDGSATPPGSPPSSPGKGGPNDRGDVNWQMQVTNAVALLKQKGSSYWGCPI
ncbi:MAG: glucosaminidase domain-containing protein [Candidatus Levyibacteriota bacterium]